MTNEIAKQLKEAILAVEAYQQKEDHKNQKLLLKLLVFMVSLLWVIPSHFFTISK